MVILVGHTIGVKRGYMAQTKMKAIKLSLPSELLEEAYSRLVAPIDTKHFYGQPSQSKVIRALLEIVLEREGQLNPDEIHDYEELKEALRSLLSEPSNPGGQ